MGWVVGCTLAVKLICSYFIIIGESSTPPRPTAPAAAGTSLLAFRETKDMKNNIFVSSVPFYL